mgnify:CR=1 FL=1
MEKKALLTFALTGVLGLAQASWAQIPAGGPGLIEEALEDIILPENLMAEEAVVINDALALIGEGGKDRERSDERRPDRRRPDRGDHRRGDRDEMLKYLIHMMQHTCGQADIGIDKIGTLWTALKEHSESSKTKRKEAFGAWRAFMEQVFTPNSKAEDVDGKATALGASIGGIISFEKGFVGKQTQALSAPEKLKAGYMCVTSAIKLGRFIAREKRGDRDRQKPESKNP